MDDDKQHFITHQLCPMLLAIALIVFLAYQTRGQIHHSQDDAQQHAASEFVQVSNAKAVDYDFHSTDNSKSYGSSSNVELKVNFRLRGHQYHDMTVIGTNYDHDTFSGIDSPRYVQTQFVSAGVLHSRGIKEYQYNVDRVNHIYNLPPLDKVLTYNHETRIPKGTYAIQLNKNYPPLKWQLKHKQVCLVMNK